MQKHVSQDFLTYYKHKGTRDLLRSSYSPVTVLEDHLQF